MTDKQKLAVIIMLARNALEFHDKKDAFAAIIDDILSIAEFSEDDE